MSNKQQAINGGKWITISTVISTVFQFVQVAILSRFLTPADFGIVSVSNLILYLFQVFTNIGLANSIIYKQEDDRKVLSTLYILSLLIGVVMFILVHLSAPFIISFYDEPKLGRVLNLSSYYFLIVYFGQMYMFLLEKELRFKSVAILDTIGTLVGAVVTISLAYNGFHELSQVIGALAMQIVKSILQILFGLRFFVPQLSFDLKNPNVLEHLRFGVYNMGEGFLGFIQSNSDNIFLGGMLGVKMLGYYTIAYQLSIFPILKLNPIILQVAYPILARMKDNAAELKRSYLKILDFISYCNMPLLAGLFITADALVPIVYGPGWEPSIELIRIFVFVSFLICLGHPLYTVAFTKGKPALLFYLNLGTMIIKVPLVYLLGTHYGVTGIAVAFLIATVLMTIANFAMVQYLIGDFMKDFLRDIVKPTLFCLVMVGIIALYKVLVGSSGITHAIVEVALGGIIYAAFTLAYKLSFAELKTYRQGLL